MVKKHVFSTFNKHIATTIAKIKLKKFKSNSCWFNKANIINPINQVNTGVSPLVSIFDLATVSSSGK